jgi:hypothetical protein
MSVVTVDQLIGNPNVAIFAANSNVQQQLQDNYAQEHLSFRLTGNLTLAGYTAAPAKLVESLENLIYDRSGLQRGRGFPCVQDTNHGRNRTDSHRCRDRERNIRFRKQLQKVLRGSAF